MIIKKFIHVHVSYINCYRLQSTSSSFYCKHEKNISLNIDVQSD